MKLRTKSGSITVEEAEQLVSSVYDRKAKLISDTEAHQQQEMGKIGIIPGLNARGEDNPFCFEYWKIGDNTILFRHIAPYGRK